MTSRPTSQPSLSRLPLQHRRPLFHTVLRPIPRTSSPPTFIWTRSQPTRIIISPLEHCPPYIRRIDFALDAAGWDPTALDVLSTILITYADVFSSSKLDDGECFLRPFEIKVPPGTRPYRLNPAFPKQADHFGLLYRSRPHSELHVAVVEPPRVCPEEIGWHPNHSQLPKAEQGHRDS